MLLLPLFALNFTPSEILVDTTRKHQVIEGFGTCLISWEPRMAKWYQRPEAARIFAQELRFNILRCNLWGDGTVGPVEDASAISYRDPAFARADPRTPVFIRFAKAIAAYNPEVKVIGTVWSPPAWMKANGSIVDDAAGAIQANSYLGEKGGRKVPFDNRVRPDRYPHFAAWLVEMAKYYRAKGVPLYALSAANEPQFTQSFESCVWTAKDLATITGMVGERLKRAGLGRIKMFGPETMTGFNWPDGPNYQYTQAFRADRRAWDSLGFFASHGYSDGVKADVSTNSSAKFWSIVKGYGKPYWVTEGGTGGHRWPDPVSPSGVGMAIHNALVAGNASAFVPWQYAEDSTSEHNLMPLSGLDKKTHVVRHFSRYIPSGSRRVEATPEYGDIAASAYTHGRDLTIVLLNLSGEAKTVRVAIRGLQPRGLHLVRTSASENSKDLGPVSFNGGRAEVQIPGPGIVTISSIR